ncbi:MAG: carbohydrate kinase [Pseudomonadota bacterium]
MILCAGEALIDMLPRTTQAGEAAFAPHAGGAVFNTAIALGRLDAPVGLLTGLSTDLFGQVLENALKASNVSSDHAIRSDRPTTLAFVKLTNGQAEYAFYDENTAGRMLEPNDMPMEIAGVKAAFFGGISLPVEPGGAAYEALCERLSTTAAIMIDPNIRRDFITDEARYRTRLEAMLERADIIKISDEDLAWIAPGQSLEDAATGYVAAGTKLVCVTKGAEGATGYWAGGPTDVTAERAEVVDTVGAGDTFNAGVMASLQNHGLLSKDGLSNLTQDAVRAALSLGAKAAAITVSRAGANPPFARDISR